MVQGSAVLEDSRDAFTVALTTDVQSYYGRVLMVQGSAVLQDSGESAVLMDSGGAFTVALTMDVRALGVTYLVEGVAG
eukprot:scaffold255908_cov18-Tisochrysis_lutea.AAC.1